MNHTISGRLGCNTASSMHTMGSRRNPSSGKAPMKYEVALTAFITLPRRTLFWMADLVTPGGMCGRSFPGSALREFLSSSSPPLTQPLALAHSARISRHSTSLTSVARVSSVSHFSPPAVFSKSL